ncbi:MAG: hypothetical protein KAX49_10980 [Halanaerobiales bacterium]|nr:hypothetical protein [Halanaerobiales bacterium]
MIKLRTNTVNITRNFLHTVGFYGITMSFAMFNNSLYARLLLAGVNQ